jgi:GNAT superfamily N-acetyltransferase
MSCHIRIFEERDWEDLAAVVRDAHKVALTAETLREEDARRDPKCFEQCWVAEVGDRVVAYGRFVQHPGAYHPRKYEWDAGVISAFRRRGIGSALLSHARTEMRVHDPLAFTAGAKEDWPESIAFLERHGFVETMRNFESTLHLPNFDPAPFADAVARAAEQGYSIKSYADLAGAPGLDKQLHALAMELRRDVPAPEPMTDVPLETWVKYLHGPDFRPDLYLVAFHGGQMVGMSTARASDEGADILATGLTGVKREHRGRGVSKALKVKALTAAKAGGGRLVKTWNETHNQRMLAVNEWLGFTRKPGWVSYVLDLKAEG